jgi:flagellum-specific peptidoglycan hydrolase FlgJ
MITPAQQSFLYAILAAAKASERSTKVPAAFTTAEAMVESGWGAHCPGMNIFGVKADSSWPGPTTTQRTREVIKGESVVIEAKFRAYSNWQGSIDDHAHFLLSNPRYALAFHTDNAIDFTKAVAAAGYATDPNYANTIISVMRLHGLV